MRTTAVLVVLAGAVVLGFCYWRLSWTVPATSDGAAIALQAHDMLHGNMLLRGWTVGDVSFYTTELPEYMLVEFTRGLGTSTIHIAAAVTYTLLVVATGFLARGRARGSEGLCRGLVGAGIMLAPQLGFGAFVLLLSPDHVGTEVPLLAGWLLLDLAPRRWYVPVALGALLAWVQVADRVSVLTAVVPLIVVCCWRILRTRPGGREAGRSVGAGWPGKHRRGRLAGEAPSGLVGRGSTARAWRTVRFEFALAAAAVVSAMAAEAAGKALAGLGGFQAAPLKFLPSPLIGTHLRLTGWGILELFGANFTGISGAAAIFFAVVHVAGLALAAAGLALALFRFLRGRPETDLVSSVLAVAIGCNVAAYMLTTAPGTVIGNGYGAREIAAVLPLGAVLAGRELPMQPGAWRAGIIRSGKSWVLATGLAALACYAAALGYGAAQPAAPAQGADLAAWLDAHHLRYGLGGVVSNITSVESQGLVRVEIVSVRHGRVAALPYQSARSSYDPRRHDATFLVAVAPVDNPGHRVSYAEAAHTFGAPARVYHFAGYTVMIWNRNLLTLLSPEV
jgi:hypothetical protein